MKQIAVIGVPSNSSGTADGVAKAPDVYRELGLIEKLKRHFAVVDLGNVPFAKPSPMRSAYSGIIGEDALFTMLDSVERTVEKVLQEGYFPLVLGGDCPLLIGCLMAARAAKKVPHLFFLDGHEDAYPPHLSPSGEAADMELGLILGQNVKHLPAPLRQSLPILNFEDVTLIGARDLPILAGEGVPSLTRRSFEGKSLTNHVPPNTRDLRKFALGLIEQAKSSTTSKYCNFEEKFHSWLHLDLDILSTQALPAVDYQQPGGIDFGQLSQLTSMLLQGSEPIGWNITIYNPDMDTKRQSGQAIVEFIVESLLNLNCKIEN